jgi:hypothetical protein
MKKKVPALWLIALLAVTFGSNSNASDPAPDRNRSALRPDILYVGDVSSSTVGSFDAGENANQPSNGDVLQYLLKNGAWAGALFSGTDAHAPFARRRAVFLNGVLYVANLTGDASGAPGEVDAFAGNGKFLGKLTRHWVWPAIPVLRLPRDPAMAAKCSSSTRKRCNTQIN